MKILCTGARASVLELDLLSSGNINYYTANFKFEDGHGASWEEFINPSTKAFSGYAVFYGNRKYIEAELIWENETSSYNALVPWEVLVEEGDLYAGVFGKLSSPTIKVLTTNMAYICRVPTGAVEALESGNPSSLFLDAVDALRAAPYIGENKHWYQWDSIVRDIIDTGILAEGTGIILKGSVATASQLPSSGNSIGDARIALDTGKIHVWGGSSWDSGVYFRGDRGYTGSRGLTGYTGSFGNRGYTGSFGDIGYTGSLGYTGSRGLTGYGGSTGARGYTGSQGVQGYSGSQGLIGYVGSQGDLGYTGSQGQSIQMKAPVAQVENLPLTGNNEGDCRIVLSNNHMYTWNGAQWHDTGQFTGYTGSKGEIGYTGSIGESGTVLELKESVPNYASLPLIGNSNGDGRVTLDTGILYVWQIDEWEEAGQIINNPGYTGSQGISGYTGSQGISGSLGYTGSAGIRGYSGSQGIQGVTGYTGSQGIQGATGYTGSKGDPGNSGETYYNASEYGILPSNSDNATAFNNLINTITGTGGTIYLPNGTYIIKSPIKWKSNVSLMGESLTKTVIRPTTTTNPGFAAIYWDGVFSKNTPMINCNFDNFTIDGIGVNISETNNSIPKGIDIHFIKDCNFRNLIIQNTAATGLGIDYLQNVIIDSVAVINCGRKWVAQTPYVEGYVGCAGIGIGTHNMGEEACVISNCIADGCHHYGIFLEIQNGAEGTLYYDTNIYSVVNNIVKNGIHAGIGIKGGENVLIANNNIYNNTYAGINITGDLDTQSIDGCLITNNIIHKNKNGILLERFKHVKAVKNLKIVDNYIYENLENGILLDVPSNGVATKLYNTTINSNTISDNGNYGISLYLGDETINTLVNYNTIHSNSSSGIIIERPSGASSSVSTTIISYNQLINNGSNNDIIDSSGIYINCNLNNLTIINNLFKATSNSTLYGISKGTSFIASNQTIANNIYDGDLFRSNSIVDVIGSHVHSYTSTSTLNLTIERVGNFIYMNPSPASINIIVNIPKTTSDSLPVGSEYEICRGNSGACTIQAESGLTIVCYTATRTIKSRYDCASLKKIGATTWLLTGSLG